MKKIIMNKKIIQKKKMIVIILHNLQKLVFLFQKSYQMKRHKEFNLKEINQIILNQIMNSKQMKLKY